MDRSICKVDIKEKFTVMTLKLDYVTSSESRELLDLFNEVFAKGAKNIILDLSGTSYMSSMVIASLVSMHKRAKGEGGKLVLSCANERIQEILDTTKLGKVFTIYHTLEAATGKMGTENKTFWGKHFGKR
jgi:anti-sigma B factor antagonist